MRKKDYKQKSSRLKELIRGLEKSIYQVEKEIRELIESDETLYEQHKRLCTVEGIGDKTAVKMIVVTKGFTDFTDARKFCCHAGVAPFSYSSGSSIRSRNRVSQRADKGIKKPSCTWQPWSLPPDAGENCMSIMKGKWLKEKTRCLS
ncbi:Transposase IS116/IS110/IS902 family protein [Bacteroidales bacterium Barb6XT]|nr:Transposase IS116/IS110/IS902 family protein [Bacteroidales bacterium Barb6XT]